MLDIAGAESACRPSFILSSTKDSATILHRTEKDKRDLRIACVVVLNSRERGAAGRHLIVEKSLRGL
eukprot:scaffold36436_cov176-Amphora_coffeaeformis.AAC.2